MNKEAKVIFTSFIYFSFFTSACKDENTDVPEELKKLFYKIAKITKMYKHALQPLLDEINIIIADYPHKDIDYLLASITIIIEYFEQTAGRKRLFYPIKQSKAVELQCDLVDGTGNNKYIDNTFAYCELLVRGLLSSKTTAMQK